MATIRKRGNNYQAVIRRSGFPQQSKSLPTKKLAQEWARSIEAKMDRGTFMDQATAKTTTFDDLINQFLVEVTFLKRSENARRTDTTVIRRIQREERALCSLTLEKLKPSHFAGYRDKRLSTPIPNNPNKLCETVTIAPATVRRELSLLQSIINHRFIDLGLPYNPVCAEYVKRPVTNNERDVRLSDEEKKRLIAACYKVRNNLIGPFVEMGFETGARRGEILSLKWNDVDIENRSALFRDVKNTRNPNKIKNRDIGLSLRAQAIMRELPKDSEDVFPMSENAFKLSFTRIRKKLGMMHFRFHDTRHDFISRMVEAGMPIGMIMAQVGHTSTRSLARYMTIKPTALANELDKYA